MGKLRDELDKMWGGPFQRDIDYIPGVLDRYWKEVRYFQDDGSGDSYLKQLGKLGAAALDVEVSGGAINGECCIISPPGTRCFFSLSYWKDLAGWRRRIEVAARRRGLLLARIDRDRFLMSDGQPYELPECIIWFDLTMHPDQPRIVRWPESYPA